MRLALLLVAAVAATLERAGVAEAASLADVREVLQDRKERLAAAVQVGDRAGASTLQREINTLDRRVEEMAGHEAAAGASYTDTDAKHQGATFACAVCELMVPGVAALVKRRRTEGAILQVAQKLCTTVDMGEDMGEEEEDDDNEDDDAAEGRQPRGRLDGEPPESKPCRPEYSVHVGARRDTRWVRLQLCGCARW